MLKQFLDKEVAILVVAGIPPRAPFLRALLQKLDYQRLYAADGGANILKEVDILPDVIVGDLDSISGDSKAYYRDKGVRLETFPREKDFSDTELALEYLLKEGQKEVIVLGALGGRADHHLANTFLLPAFGRRGMNLHLLDEFNLISYLKKGEYLIPQVEDAYLSFFALGDAGLSLSLEGVKYPLSKKQLPFGSSLCLSNRFTKAYAKIEVFDGDGYVILSKE